MRQADPTPPRAPYKPYWRNDGSLCDRSDVCPLSYSIPCDPQEIIPGISEIEMLQVCEGISVPADKWIQNYLQGGYRTDDCLDSDQFQQGSDAPPRAIGNRSCRGVDTGFEASKDDRGINGQGAGVAVARRSGRFCNRSVQTTISRTDAEL